MSEIRATLDGSASTSEGAPTPSRARRPLHLLVIGESLIETHPLPASGRVTIGRAETNDIRIDHTEISREHAVIHLGEQLAVEDLGSRNGTKVRNKRIQPSTKVPIARGEVVELGSTMTIVQRARESAPRVLQPHTYFEARLDEACASARLRHSSFAILRVHVGGRAEPRAIEAALTGPLVSQDLVAAYARGEYEIFLAEAKSDRAQEVSAAIRAVLEKSGASVQIGAALFPADGQTRESLLAAACSAVRPAHARAAETAFVVKDAAMIELYRVVERVARGTISILLLGETGAGKEVFAEAVHRASPRRARKFVRINCAALAETLLESELFGHEQGAFTGAIKTKPGLIETAEGGTLFLDEVGEMPPATQAKLLRVLEQKQVMRVGGLEARSVDVRFVAATNRDLEAEVVAGRFRPDLYFRLNGMSLVIPPLRERPAELEALAELFVARVSEELGREDIPRISDRAMELLRGYRWPGNIRELRNVMERAVLLCSEEVIEPEHLPAEKLTTVWASSPRQAAADQAGESDQVDGERRRIIEAIESCGGNQSRAAELLGISRRTLTTKLNKYGLPRPRKGMPASRR